MGQNVERRQLGRSAAPSSVPWNNHRGPPAGLMESSSGNPSGELKSGVATGNNSSSVQVEPSIGKS